MTRDKVLVKCIVNEKEVAEYVDPRESLLDMLKKQTGAYLSEKGM